MVNISYYNPHTAYISVVASNSWAYFSALTLVKSTFAFTSQYTGLRDIHLFDTREESNRETSECRQLKKSG